MSFIAKMFMPKMPALPKIELPKVENVPSAEDEARKGPIRIRLNPNKVITTESWDVDPFTGKKTNYKKTSETVSGKKVK